MVTILDIILNKSEPVSLHFESRMIECQRRRLITFDEENDEMNSRGKKIGKQHMEHVELCLYRIITYSIQIFIKNNEQIQFYILDSQKTIKHYCFAILK